MCLFYSSLGVIAFGTGLSFALGLWSIFPIFTFVLYIAILLKCLSTIQPKGL